MATIGDIILFVGLDGLWQKIIATKREMHHASSFVKNVCSLLPFVNIFYCLTYGCGSVPSCGWSPPHCSLFKLCVPGVWLFSPRAVFSPAFSMNTLHSFADDIFCLGKG